MQNVMDSVQTLASPTRFQKNQLNLKVLKEETNKECDFTYVQKFISIMNLAQVSPTITKDMVLYFIQLFYSNNDRFIQLFQRSFLLIFKTLGQYDARSFTRQISIDYTKGYQDLLKQFLNQMIQIQFKLIKSQEKQQYFQNFVDYYLSFFSQAIMSKKHMISQTAHRILLSSLRLMEQKLQLELFPQTRQKLIDSAFYQLTLKPDQLKLKGVQLYEILQKIDISSEQIDELLFQYLQSLKNFKIRKEIIRSTIKLNGNQQSENQKNKRLERFLNRLKDINPLIQQQVINKLITQNIQPCQLTHEQVLKVLIQGYSSAYENVKLKSLQYLGNYLKRCLDEQNQGQNNNEPKNNDIQNLQKNKQHEPSSIFSNKILFQSSLYSLDDPKPMENNLIKQNRIKKFMQIFQSPNGFQPNYQLFTSNPLVSSTIIKLINQLALSKLTPAQTQRQILKIFNKLNKKSIQTLSEQQVIFLYSIIKGVVNNAHNSKSGSIRQTKLIKIHKNLYQKDNNYYDLQIQENQKQIKNFINSCTQLLSPNQLISCLQYLLKKLSKLNINKDQLNQHLTQNSQRRNQYFQKITSGTAIISYLLKLIELLSIDLDVYDVMGKKIIKQELRRIINEYDFIEDKENGRKIGNLNKEKIIQSELIKFNTFLNSSKAGDPLQSNEISQIIINNPTYGIFSLLITCYQNISLHSQPNNANQKYQLKILTNQLIHNKQIKFQLQMMKSMSQKTASQQQRQQKQVQLAAQVSQVLQVPKKSSSQKLENNLNPNPESKFSALNQEINKKITKNKERIKLNYTKGLMILIQDIRIKGLSNNEQNKNDNVSKVSQYFDLLKNQLDYLSNMWWIRGSDSNFMKINHEELNYVEIALLLLFSFCCQSYENYNNFKKLFEFYALDQQKQVMKQQKQLTQEDNQEGSVSLYKDLIKYISLRLFTELIVKYSDELSEQNSLNLSKEQKQTEIRYQEQICQKLMKKVVSIIDNQERYELEQKFYKQILLKLTFRRNKIEYQTTKPATKKPQSLILLYADQFMNQYFKNPKSSLLKAIKPQDQQLQFDTQQDTLILMVLKLRQKLLLQSNSQQKFFQSFQQMLTITYSLCDIIFQFLKQNSQFALANHQELKLEDSSVKNQKQGKKKLIHLFRIKKIIDVTTTYELNKFLANSIEMAYFSLVKKCVGSQESLDDKNNQVQSLNIPLKERLLMFILHLKLIQQINKNKSPTKYDSNIFYAAWKFNRLLPQLSQQTYQTHQSHHVKQSDNYKKSRQSLKTIQLQILVFTKNCIEKFLQQIETKTQSILRQANNSCINLVQDIRFIDQVIGEEISQRIYNKKYDQVEQDFLNNNMNYESCSTEISPNLYEGGHNKIIEEGKGRERQFNGVKDKQKIFIQMDKIEKYQKQLEAKIMEIKQNSIKIVGGMKENGILGGIKNNWNKKISSLITKDNNLIENNNFNSIQIENQHHEQALEQEERQKNSQSISAETHPNHSSQPLPQTSPNYEQNIQTRRQKKITFLGKNPKNKSKYKQQQELQQCTVSFKKNRLIIFPFQIVQNAQRREKMEKKKKLAAMRNNEIRKYQRHRTQSIFNSHVKSQRFNNNSN